MSEEAIRLWAAAVLGFQVGWTCRMLPRRPRRRDWLFLGLVCLGVAALHLVRALD